MAAQTSDKKLDGAGLGILWGLIKGIIPTVPTNVSDFTNDSQYVSLLDSHNANLVLASPNGTSGYPSFRSLVAADIPDLSGTYLTSASLNGYATQSWVTSQGFGTVSSIKVGTTSYSPSSGVVSLPAYPTTLPASDVYSWAKQSTKPSYSYSEISGTPSSLPASDVYSWAKASSKPSYTLDEISDGSTRKLADYLPLSGGKLTGYVDISSNGFLSLGEVNTKAQTILGVYNNTSMNDGSLCIGSSITFNIGRTTTKSFGLKVTGESVWFGTFGFSFINNNLSGRELIRITYYGDVGLGVTNPSYKLHVNGAVGATAFTNTSDIRNKDFLSDISLNIESIADAPIFRYKWRNSEDLKIHAGSSAQYWQTVLPESVFTAQDEQRTLSMQYDAIALLSAITIAKEVVNDKERIRQLEERVTELESQIAN